MVETGDESMSYGQEIAEQMNQSESQERADRDWHLYVDKVFKAKAPILFKSLCEAMEETVSEFNNAITNQGLKIEFQKIPSNRALLRRPRYPILQLNVWLDLDSRFVRFTTAAKRDCESSSHQTIGRLRICVFAEGTVQLANGEDLLDTEKASKLLLAPFFIQPAI